MIQTLKSVKEEGKSKERIDTTATQEIHEVSAVRRPSIEQIFSNHHSMAEKEDFDEEQPKPLESVNDLNCSMGSSQIDIQNKLNSVVSPSKANALHWYQEGKSSAVERLSLIHI